MQSDNTEKNGGQKIQRPNGHKENKSTTSVSSFTGGLTLSKRTKSVEKTASMLNRRKAIREKAQQTLC